MKNDIFDNMLSHYDLTTEQHRRNALFVKEDVMPFVRNPKELDIWSNDYFVQLAGMVVME
jgi:hypothetical protein